MGGNISKTFLRDPLLPVLLAVVLPVGWLLVCPGKAAGEEPPVLIRVSLSPQIPTASVEGNPHFWIAEINSGPEKQTFSRVVIAVASSGLTINGENTGLQELQIEPDKGPLRINGLPVKGYLVIRKDGGSLRVINTLPLEEYLKGVVPVEISAEWHSEALKVQAIISRTYALYQKGANRQKDYDLVSSNLDQVYQGTKREHPAANQAILETRGMVLTYHGEVIQSFFHSTSAGPTEDASEVWGVDLPYLKGVSCPLDEASPYYDWTVSFPMAELTLALRRAGWSVGTVSSIVPLKWTAAGRVEKVQILHSLGEITLKGNDFRRILGYSKLPSTQFIIQTVGPKLRVRGLGSGHAVGLCQWGAKQMAEMGYSHESILHHYYPGAEIKKFTSGTNALLLP